MEKQENQQPEQKTDEVAKLIKQAKNMVDGDNDKGLIAIYHDGGNLRTNIVGKHIILAAMLADNILTNDDFKKILKTAILLVKMNKEGLLDELEKKEND